MEGGVETMSAIEEQRFEQEEASIFFQSSY